MFIFLTTPFFFVFPVTSSYLFPAKEKEKEAIRNRGKIYVIDNRLFWLTGIGDGYRGGGGGIRLFFLEERKAIKKDISTASAIQT